MAAGTPDFSGAAEIERRARQIKDPVARLRYLRDANLREAGPPKHRLQWRWMACALLVAAGVIPMGSDATVREAPHPPRPAPVSVRRPPAPSADVWPVELTNAYEVYSNGLRIENNLSIANEPRSYTLLARESGTMGPHRDQPAGIVFHTTESDQAPFEAGQAHALKRIGKELLLYVRNKRAYHFLIDRFGRVHRIVAESDAANHAGHSVWADSRWVYMDLNMSFLGVAFEARTQPGQQSINQAQIHAGAILTDMLRSKYNLPPENCVTHAQVSVNPDNMRVGWHTDWGSDFPFREIGLPNNYERPNPGLFLFGFEYDPAYINSTSPDLWKGLELAEDRVREMAAARGTTVPRYRRLLQKRYREALFALHNRSALEEN